LQEEVKTKIMKILHESNHHRTITFKKKMQENESNPAKNLPVTQVVEGLDAPPSPASGDDMAFSGMLNDLITGELATINDYNTAISMAREAGNADIATILSNIADEEHRHIGELQKALSLVSPQEKSIDAGKKEAGELLANMEDISMDVDGSFTDFDDEMHISFDEE